MIPSVRGDRTGTGLVAESGPQWFRVVAQTPIKWLVSGLVKFNVQSRPVAGTTSHVSIEP